MVQTSNLRRSNNLHLDIDSALKINFKTKAIIVVNMLGMVGPIHQLKASLDAHSFAYQL